MTKSPLKVEFSFDKGYEEGILNISREKVCATFKEIMPESLEYKNRNLMEVEATTLQIFISGLAIGGGIVVTKFLEECGKDLWKIFKKLFLTDKSKNNKKLSNSHDKIQLEADISEHSITLTLSGSDLQSMDVVKDFLTNGPTRLYKQLSSKIEAANSGN